MPRSSAPSSKGGCPSQSSSGSGTSKSAEASMLPGCRPGTRRAASRFSAFIYLFSKPAPLTSPDHLSSRPPAAGGGRPSSGTPKGKRFPYTILEGLPQIVQASCMRMTEVSIRRSPGRREGQTSGQARPRNRAEIPTFGSKRRTVGWFRRTSGQEMAAVGRLGGGRLEPARRPPGCGRGWPESAGLSPGLADGWEDQPPARRSRPEAGWRSGTRASAGGRRTGAGETRAGAGRRPAQAGEGSAW
jgi:hypothetical protein